jgi:hypothetical protein
MSSRSASASRRTLCASRWSSQNPGSAALASSSERRRSRPARSKTPRGRGDPGGEVADGGLVHLAPCSHLLEQLWSELEDLERRLAARDDGVHAWAIRIVRTWPAVAVAVEPGGVTAAPTIALARDQIGERLVTELRIRRWKRLHGPLSLPLEAHTVSGIGSRVASRARTTARCTPRVYGVRPERHKRRARPSSSQWRTARPLTTVVHPVARRGHAHQRCLYLTVHAQHPGPPRGRR